MPEIGLKIYSYFECASLKKIKLGVCRLKKQQLGLGKLKANDFHRKITLFYECYVLRIH